MKTCTQMLIVLSLVMAPTRWMIKWTVVDPNHRIYLAKELRELLMHVIANNRVSLQWKQLSEQSWSQKVHAVWFHIYTVMYTTFVLTKLEKWRRDSWLPGIKEGLGRKENGHGCKKAICRILVMEMYYVLTVSMSKF